MVSKAYVLITAAVGQAEALAIALTGKPGINSADTTLGPYDVIAVVEATDAESVAKVVLNEIATLEGVNHTTTCLVLSKETQQD